MPDCTIGIVNYNTRDLLRTCIEAALKQSADELAIIDSGSTDGSIEMVQSLFPAVHLIQAPNQGFGAAANHLLESCRTPYLLILNSDAILHPQAVSTLVRELEMHPKAAIAAPRLYSCNGTVQRSWRQFPGSLAWLVDNGISRSLLGGRAVSSPRSV